MMEQEKLTMEERIARAARSQAASPEAAVRLVQQLAQLHTVHIFHGCDDLTLMYELIGPYMEQMDDDLLHYSGFCRSIYLALADNKPPAGVDPRFLPAMGVLASNAVVLLGLMLLDHAKGRGQTKNIYHCTRMTLGQYLDALDAAAFSHAGNLSLNFRSWREEVLNVYPASTPLGDVLGDILRLYIHGWKRLDCFDHVVRCMKELSSYLEEEETADLDREFREAMRQAVSTMGLSNVEVVEEDEREQYPDPVKHYLDLALAYSWDAVDPAGETVKARAVRSQIFLSDWDYSPQAVEQLMEQAPTPEFRVLLEQFISEQQPVSGMSEVNRAVSILFTLCVWPYLQMDKRP